MALLGLVPLVSAARAQDASEKAMQEMTAAVNTYKLTPDNLRKATAIDTAFLEKLQADPALAKRYASFNRNPASLDEAMKQLDADPDMAAAITAGGMTTRDYALTTVVVQMGSLLAAADTADADLSATGKANLAFIKANGPAVQALGHAQQQLERAKHR